MPGGARNGDQRQYSLNGRRVRWMLTVRKMKLFLAALLAALPGLSARAKPPASLCRTPEPVLFTCHLAAKLVSVCGTERGGAVYCYGRPGRLEIETTDLHRAFEGWSGGGETQAYADTPTHRYVVFDRMVRIGIDDEGHNIPRMT